MTRTLAVDANNDIYLGPGGRLAVVTGLDAVLLLCAHAAKTLLGEMVLAIDQGLPYFQALWSGAPNIPVFEAAYRQRILAVQDVTGIVEVTFTVQGSVLSYAATISTIYGTGVVNG